MDLIYMNASREDIGVLLAYELDLSFGANENDFALKVGEKNHCCEAGYFIYAQGTEYGGIIDAVTSDTATGEVTYSGRTWHGILNSKVLEPDAGQDYLTVQGEANAVLASLVARCGLDGLFSVSTEDSGITLPKYAMNRYISAYDGIRKMLQTVNAKLLMHYGLSGVSLSVAPVVDHTQSGLDSDVVDFSAKRTKGKVNHLICLGSGELKDRTVLHLYADADGNIGKTQSLFGVNEYTEVYDYSGVEDVEELEKGGRDRLKELLQQDELSVSIDDTSNLFDIGDIVGARDNVTGVSVAVPIAQKIVTIKDGITEVSYSTDTVGSSSSSGYSGEESSGSGASMAALNDHINNKNNPHEVKAAQVEGLAEYVGENAPVKSVNGQAGDVVLSFENWKPQSVMNTTSPAGSFTISKAYDAVSLASFTATEAGLYLLYVNYWGQTAFTSRTWISVGSATRASVPQNMTYPCTECSAVLNLDAGQQVALTLASAQTGTFKYEKVVAYAVRLA